MPRYKLVVLSRPAAGREREYNVWYQNLHLDQMVAVKGFISAQRFRLERNLTEGEAWPYLCIYELETDDLEAVVREVRGRAGGEALFVSEALDTMSAYASFYEEFGAVVTR